MKLIKLRKIMNAQLVNRAKLSRLTGIPQSTLCRYFNGERKPKYEQVARIAKALNTKTEVIY